MVKQKGHGYGWGVKGLRRQDWHVAETKKVVLIFLLTVFFNVYLFLRERERQSVSGGGAQGDTCTESEAVSGL